MWCSEAGSRLPLVKVLYQRMASPCCNCTLSCPELQLVSDPMFNAGLPCKADSICIISKHPCFWAVKERPKAVTS